MQTTAKIRLNSRMDNTVTGSENVVLKFGADYADDRNKEWAYLTPQLTVEMVVRPEVAERFQVGQAFTLTFDTEDQADTEATEGAETTAPPAS